MPLSRSNTSRSKSRSPAPPISQSSPQYFPPSHFAAAGGFILPDNARVEQSGMSLSGEPSSQDAYMPVSYLSSASSDPSSFDFNDNQSIESRSRKSSVDSSRKKRESQIHNLPLVEAQLLPSLRDTIDKMTRPPSRMTGSSNSNTPTITFSRKNGSEDYSSGSGSIDVSPYAPPSPRLKPPSTVTRMPTAGEDRPTTPNRPTTPKTGSVLKSALKAPTPKISSSPSPTPTPVSSPGGAALRSVRSLLRRKSSTSTAIPSSISEDQAAKENHPATSFDVSRQTNTRSRSCTDPGTFVPAKEQSNILTAQSNCYSNSKSHQTAHTSHIPRLRGGSFAPVSARQFVKNYHSGASVSTDESDFEYRYEVEGRDRRKLTVMNAVVVPSSSSESEDDPSFHSRLHTYSYNQRFPARGKPSQGQVLEGKIGLGLMLKDRGRTGERRLQLQPQDEYNNDGSDRVRIYHEEHNYEHVRVETAETDLHSTSAVQMRQSRSSIVSYPSAGSIYSTDEEEAELSDATGSGSGIGQSSQTLSLNELDQTHSRRKAALLGLVQGLDNLSLRSANDSSTAAEASGGRSILSEGESDYCGEKGLAVSRSLGEGTNKLDDGHQESASESDYGLEGSRTVFVPSTPRTPTTRKSFDSSTLNGSSRASRYSSPSESNPNTYYAEKEPDSARVPSSKNSKRHSLHPSSAISPSPSPVPSGRYNNLPPSPRLSTSTKDKDKASIAAESPRSQVTSNQKDQKVISKRKSYTRDVSSSVARSPSHASCLSPISTAMLSHRRMSPTAGSTIKRESHNSYESVVLAKRSMEAMVRTRQAFGIPPSESDAIYRSPAPNSDHDSHIEHGRDDSQDTNSSMLPPADSIASGVDVAMERSSWEHEEDNELSFGAENLFKTLSQGGKSSGEARGRSHRVYEEKRSQRYESQQQHTVISTEEEPKRNEITKPKERRQSRHRSRTPVARASPAQRSMNGNKSNKFSTPSSWRSLVGPDRYDSLLHNYGELEIQRQEVIWEVRTAETEYVERLSSVVELFIIPLRIHATKTWIAGVPLEIAKILDWVEDIANLHTQIRDTMQSFQTTEFPFAGPSRVEDRHEVGVAYAIRAFVPKLEMYQPYLVKVSSVLEMLERLVKDGGSDFGEFVRMQEKTQECRMSLANMLQEPANRIMMYPDLFRKLLNVTPKNHEEYLPTLMLVYSISLVIKTLQTVKAREEEYEFIKSISERIDGLPTSTNLARRDRRLLCHGQLLCLNLNQDFTNDSRRTSSLSKTKKDSDRANRLVDAINDWDIRRSRSGSVKSNNSASTGISFRSVETSSPPPPPQLSVLVFSDLVVLATARIPLRDNSNHQEQQGLERWTICDDLGVARILGVEEMDSNGTNANADESPLITVDLLPIEYDLNKGSSCVGTRLETLQFQLPFNASPSNPSRETWISAFQRSAQSTLRNLSNPGFSQTGGDIEGPNQLLEQDRRRILESILQTGLPFPKSPSLQLADESMGRGGISDSMQMEREERGWWSLQFQQSLRENWYDQTAS
ncbi:hypothetical protein DFH05DRAFT_1483662 [Lentinula detonsa]|uniref:DH domain-containing protein n=1 Tax=Lentinula detonsa TaxID=2804962 RepID=A0A9W8P334_9AGAR|nr:hypothetical protein DFH05DRAFT_1483662 [Lentinula detonsa]